MTTVRIRVVALTLVVVLHTAKLTILSGCKADRSSTKESTTSFTFEVPTESEIAELQLSVTEGHQPWRCDPLEVGRVYGGIALTEQAHLPGAEIPLLEEDKRWSILQRDAAQATVRWTGERHQAEIVVRSAPKDRLSPIWYPVSMSYGERGG